MSGLMTLNERAISNVHKERVTDIFVLNDGNSQDYYTVSRDKKAYKWQLTPNGNDAGSLISQFSTHSHFVTSVVCCNDVVITSSTDRTARIYADKEIILKGHTDEVTCVAINKKSNKIITGSIDKTIRIWNANGELTNTYEQPDWVMHVAFVPSDDDIVIVALNNGLLRIVNLETGAELFKITEDSEITAIAISPSGDLCIYGTRTAIKMINLDKYEIFNEVEMEAAVTDIAFAPRFQLLSIATKKGILLLDVMDNKIVCRLDQQKNIFCTALGWSYQNLICGFKNGKICVYECKKGE